MQLKQLLLPWLIIADEFDRPINSLSIDSRRILLHDMFIALVGKQVDGRNYITKALQFGSSAILVEGVVPTVKWYDNDTRVPYISLPNLNSLYGYIAARFYGEPSQHLQVIGITGTNGKTSCAHYIATILNGLGKPCGVIGTLGNGALGNLQKSKNTTPDAITIQRFLAEMRQQKFHSVVIEVSSHALDQHRVNGVYFAAGIFTNLSLDHLDYHLSFDAYSKAKQKLFTQYLPAVMVLNADDKYGQRWLQQLSSMSIRKTWYQRYFKKLIPAAVKLNSAKKIFGFTLNNKMKQLIPCSTVSNIYYSKEGSQARLDSPWGQGELKVPLLGEFNLSNVLAAITVLLGLGEDLTNVLKQLPTLSAVKGRAQLLMAAGKPSFVIDYAHTPDALAKILLSLRAYAPKKLWCVFGCGGDREKTKRASMGKIASQYADVIVLTDDNCRSENPVAIVADIILGIPANKTYHLEHDRARAIEFAMQNAQNDDMILLAGKGHEDYQEVNGQRHYFSDIDEVVRLLKI